MSTHHEPPEFSVEWGEPIVSGILVYRRYEYSFGFAPVEEDSAILVADINIGFLTDHQKSFKRATYVDGYHHYRSWIPVPLQIPHYRVGSLVWLNGVNEIGYIVRIKGTETWQTSYDQQTGWICVGDTQQADEDQVVEFATDCIAVIHQKSLKALWLKPLIIEREEDDPSLDHR